MALKHDWLGPEHSRDVPHPDCPITASRGQQAALAVLGREADARNLTLMTLSNVRTDFEKN